MDKRYYILGGLLVLLIIVLVLFLATRNRTPKGPTTSTVTIWDSFDSEEDFSDIFSQFLAENKDLDIKFVKKDPAKFEEESINAIAAGTGPDIWIIPNNWLAKHHDKLATLASKKLDPKGKKTNAEIFQATFLDAAGQDCIISDQVYCLPLFADSLSLFYNSELFSSKLSDYARAHQGQDITDVRQLFNNPPKTWEDLSQFIKYYGQGAIAIGGAKNVTRASDILTALMLQYGAQMTSDDKTAALFQTSTNKFSDVAYPGTKGLSFYTSFATRNDARYTWDESQNDYNAFTSGKIAMYLDWSRRAKDIKKDTGRAAEVAALPQFKESENPQDIANYQVLTVPKSSQNAERAWALISYILDPQIQMKYISKTGLPQARKDKVQGSDVFIDVQNQYASSWYNPEPTKVDQIFREAASAVISGENPQTVLEGAAAQITNLLKALPK